MRNNTKLPSKNLQTSEAADSGRVPIEVKMIVKDSQDLFGILFLMTSPICLPKKNMKHTLTNLKPDFFGGQETEVNSDMIEQTEFSQRRTVGIGQRILGADDIISTSLASVSVTGCAKQSKLNRWGKDQAELLQTWILGTFENHGFFFAPKTSVFL